MGWRTRLSRFLRVSGESGRTDDMDELVDPIPMLVLLLKRARFVPVEEVARVVAAVVGPEASASVRLAAGSLEGMQYIDWDVDGTPYHLGTSSGPYLKRIGVGKAGEPVRWTMQEEIPPRQERHCEAWMSHEAWMYVDALTIGELSRAPGHVSNVLRIASHFIDEDCVLVWLQGGVDKHVSLPTARVRAALARGVWREE